MAEPVILNAHQLRLVAEAASSRRAVGGEASFLVPALDSAYPHLPVKIVGDADGAAPYDALLEVDTKDLQPRRPPIYRLILDGGEAERPMVKDLHRDYDAVFWSEAAVEKFVLPYYASKSLWFAAHVLGALSRAWYGFIPGAGNDAEAAEEVPTGDIPFALAHLPSSDYVGVAENGTRPGADLHLLFRNDDGSTRYRALSEYLEAEWPGREGGF